MSANILIVEDNPDNAQLMDYLLRAAGYKPRVADGGAEGILAFELSEPDLVLLDIQMPEIDGFQVIESIRAQVSPGGGPPVVAVTAFAMVGDRDRIVQAGFDGFITKPIAPDRFVEEVESHLTERRGRTGSGRSVQ